MLEDISGVEITGYRAPGFGIRSTETDFFSLIKKAGYLYDSSLYAGLRHHGGIVDSSRNPIIWNTPYGDLKEFGISLNEIMGKRINLISGGYFRLFPWMFISKGLKLLWDENRFPILYLHPRDLDKDQPRLNLSLMRHFRSYVGLNKAMEKFKLLNKIGNSITLNTFSERNKNWEYQKIS